VPAGPEPDAVAVDSRTKTAWVADFHDYTVTEYRYTRPQFLSPSRVTFHAGRATRFRVSTSGFPFAVMSLTGKLPPGLRAKIGHGTIVISGTPTQSARNHIYRISLTADNGIGTTKGQYTVTQHLVIKVT